MCTRCGSGRTERGNLSNDSLTAGNLLASVQAQRHKQATKGKERKGKERKGKEREGEAQPRSRRERKTPGIAAVVALTQVVNIRLQLREFGVAPTDGSQRLCEVATFFFVGGGKRGRGLGWTTVARMEGQVLLFLPPPLIFAHNFLLVLSISRLPQQLFLPQLFATSGCHVVHRDDQPVSLHVAVRLALAGWIAEDTHTRACL